MMLSREYGSSTTDCKCIIDTFLDENKDVYVLHTGTPLLAIMCGEQMPVQPLSLQSCVGGQSTGGGCTHTPP